MRRCSFMWIQQKNWQQRSGGNAKVIAEEPYYRHIPRNGLNLSTRLSMAVSDRLCMVKMIQLKL